MNTEEQRQLLAVLYIQLTITYYLATQTRARVKTLTKSSTHYYLSHIVLCTTELILLSTSRFSIEPSDTASHHSTSPVVVCGLWSVAGAVSGPGYKQQR